MSELLNLHDNAVRLTAALAACSTAAQTAHSDGNLSNTVSSARA